MNTHYKNKEYQDNIINKETHFLYNKKNHKILTPLTKEAFKFWSEGTRWCDDIENDDVFDEYYEKIPLYIVILPNSKKFQFWRSRVYNENEAIDELNNRLKKENIKENWNYFNKIKDIIDLSIIPEEFITKKICELSVLDSGYALEYVPDHLKNQKLCELSVKNNVYAIEFVPDHLKTRKMCENVVRQNVFLLEYIPEHLKPKEMCEEDLIAD